MCGRNIGAIFSGPRPCLCPITGWFDPTSNGGAVRLAANSYLPAKGDAGVRLPGLRRGDLVTMDNGRVTSVNGLPPTHLDQRPDFAKLGAVHPSRPLRLETPQASSPRTAEIQRVVDLIRPLGFGHRALIGSPPKAGKTVMLQAVAEGVALNQPAAILLITVFPALGGETIRARWPKPRGQIKSTTRWISAVRGLEAWGVSSRRGRDGCTAPSFAKSDRWSRWVGGRPLTLVTRPFSMVTRSPRRRPGRRTPASPLAGR